MELLCKIVAIFSIFHYGQYQMILQVLGKSETQIVNLEFYSMTIFHKMVAISPFLDNDQCQFQISFDNSKIRESNFRGSAIWNFTFTVRWFFTKWWPCFHYYIMADTNFSFLSILAIVEIQTVNRVSNLDFTVWWFFMKCWPCSLQHSCVMTFLRLTVQNGWCEFVNCLVSQSLHHSLLDSFNIQAWLYTFA